MKDDMNIRAEAEYYDENTVTVSILVDETSAQDPSKLRFLLPDGTELKVERSEGVEQADGKAVYEATGVKP